MLSNKAQQFPQSKSTSVNISNYLIQFSYNKKSLSPHRTLLRNNIDSCHLTRKKYSGLTQFQNIYHSCHTHSFESPKKRKGNGLSLLTEGNQPAITQAFPCRKVKTNQHQLFKILAKLEYYQAKKKRKEFDHKSKQIPLQESPRKNNRSQHKRPSHLCSWVKERYRVNRDKDNGNFPKMFFRSVSNPLEEPIKVINPTQR